MRIIKIVSLIMAICFLISGCAAIDNVLPELKGKDREMCISAIKYFEECANNLDGAKLKHFTNNPEIIFTHEAALDRYGKDMNETTKNAYWAVVIVNDLLPKDYELTDLQLKSMKLEIIEGSMRGLIDSNAFVDAIMSFDDGKTESKKVSICMHVEKSMTSAAQIGRAHV